MTERPRAVLRLEPHMIPELRAAFAEALRILRPRLASLRNNGHIHEAWIGHPASQRVVDFYERHVMGDEPHTAMSCLTMYEQELMKVYDVLTAMEENYRLTESGTAALMGRYL